VNSSNLPFYFLFTGSLIVIFIPAAQKTLFFGRFMSFFINYGKTVLEYRFRVNRFFKVNWSFLEWLKKFRPLTDIISILKKVGLIGHNSLGNRVPNDVSDGTS